MAGSLKNMLNIANMKNIFVIVNPASSHGKTKKRWIQIREQLLAEDMAFDHVMTEAPGDATVLCRDALEKGYSTLIAVGGDGTLNEVVNGFFAVDGETRQRAALGIISTGTGGDFARAVQLPRTIPEAVQRIRQGQLRRLDVGLITYQLEGGETVKRYFCNIADVGLGGFIINRSSNRSKILGGMLYFLLSTLSSVVLYQNREISMIIDESLQWQGKVVIVVAGNGQYFGGGMRITPLASLDDGLLDFLLIKEMGKARLMANLYRVYKGRHLELNDVELYRGKKIRIEAPADILLEMDGERAGKTPVEIEVLPGMLNCIV